MIAVVGLAAISLGAQGWLSAGPEPVEPSFDDGVVVEFHRGCMAASYNLDLRSGRDGTAVLTAWPRERESRVFARETIGQVVAAFRVQGFARMPRKSARAPVCDSGGSTLSLNDGATRKRVSAGGGSPDAAEFHAVFHDVDAILGVEAWREEHVERARALAESRRPE